MRVDPKFLQYFEEVMQPQIPFGGSSLDYDDPDDNDADDEDDDSEWLTELEEWCEDLTEDPLSDA